MVLFLSDGLRQLFNGHAPATQWHLNTYLRHSLFMVAPVAALWNIRLGALDTFTRCALDQRKWSGVQRQLCSIDPAASAGSTVAAQLPRSFSASSEREPGAAV